MWHAEDQAAKLVFVCQMPFVKKQKNDAYFSRYQVKYRRRREGKTDCAFTKSRFSSKRTHELYQTMRASV
jgi:hypothetical protein